MDRFCLYRVFLKIFMLLLKSVSCYIFDILLIQIVVRSDKRLRRFFLQSIGFQLQLIYGVK